MEEVRIDKFLWEVRLFKTRSLSADACKAGRIFINGLPVKSSRTIKKGETVQVKQGAVKFSFFVLSLPNGRIGAKLVSQYLKDTTPTDQLELLELTNLNNGFRERGLGRPTKKERRDLDSFSEFHLFFDDFESE